MNSAAIGRMLLAGIQVPLRQDKLIEAHSEWLIQRADGWWMMPSAGSRLKRVPKSVPVNRLGLIMLHGEQNRIGGRFFEHGKTEIHLSIDGSVHANELAFMICTTMI
jgi:hypothetical protein